jgi:hypothetical protein
MIQASILRFDRLTARGMSAALWLPTTIREAVMHAVARTYTGVGAKEFTGLLASRVDEVERLMSAVDGFESYTVVRTEEGGITITVSRDKASADDSMAVARKWVAENAVQTGIGPPKVTRGEVLLACGTIHRVSKAA